MSANIIEESKETIMAQVRIYNNASGMARRVKEILAPICRPGRDAEFEMVATMLSWVFLLHEAKTGASDGGMRRKLDTLLDNTKQDTLYCVVASEMVATVINLVKKGVFDTSWLEGILRVAKREVLKKAKRERELSAAIVAMAG